MDLKPFKLDTLTPFYPATDASPLGNGATRTTAARAITTRERKRRAAEMSRPANAAAQIGELPSADGSLHLVLRGDFELFDLIRAAIELAGQRIDALTIATGGLSRRNIDALCALANAGQLARCALLCSTFFAKHEAERYRHAAELFTARGWPINFARSNAKLLLIALGARRLVIESSANLRRSHNAEQATIVDDAALFDFHREWIDEFLKRGIATP